MSTPGSTGFSSMPSATLMRIRSAVLRMADKAAFDWRYGTETSNFVANAVLRTSSANKPFGIEYQPTPTGEFRRMLREVPPPLDSLHFLDYGCGKGRTLLLAAQAGFRRITGLDYAPDMVEIARRNIAIFQPRVPGARMEVLAADAMEFEPPTGNCVLFFYNPFNEKVMAPVVQNLRRSQAAHPRQWYVMLYNCSKCQHLFDDLQFLRPLAGRPRRRSWLTQTLCEWKVYGPSGAVAEGDQGRPVIR